MKQIKNWMYAAIFLISAQMMLTSCEKYVEATVEGLFKPLTDAADEYEEKRRQGMLDAVFDWKIGCTTEQFAIDLYGYDRCFQVVPLTPEFWSGDYAPDVNPAVDKEQLCLVRCLTHSQYGLRIGGIVCNKYIANDVLYILRKLFESDYKVDYAMTASGYCKENLVFDNTTYSYFYDEHNPASATTLEQQGLSVVLNAGQPLASNDLAVVLFKERGFRWGGDEPHGNPNSFMI